MPWSQGRCRGKATGGRVVPRASAVVPGAADAEPIAIHANHVDMVRFFSKEDSGYKTLSGHLQLMTESASNVVSLRWDEVSRVSTNPVPGLPPAGTQISGARVHIKPLPLVMISITDNIDSWQDYWHEDTILPAGAQSQALEPLSTEDYEALQRGPEQLVQLATAPSTTSEQHARKEYNSLEPEPSSPELLLKIAEFMATYQEELMAQLELFPNIKQQRTLFGAMLRMTKGNLAHDSNTNRTLLHWFAMNDIHQLIPKLVELGFNVNDRNSDYRTLLHLAVISNNYWVVEALIRECHADPNMKDLRYLLPWHLALAIDDNVIENDERTRSKAAIIALLAKHTDESKIKGVRSRKIMQALRENPDAEIVLTSRGSQLPLKGGLFVESSGDVGTSRQQV